MQQHPPGVYINELNAFSNSVAEVATAVPVFIGFTATASYNGEDLTNKPRRVTSLKEFEIYFGRGTVPVFDLRKEPASGRNTRAALAVEPLSLRLHDAALEATDQQAPVLKTYALLPDEGSILYYLYNSMRLFYQNGGATCYIVSIGRYDDADAGKKLGNTGGTKETVPTGKPSKEQFIQAIDLLIDEPEPTLLLCPDALCLSEADYYAVARKMLQHCNETQSRMAVLDVYQGAVTNPLDLDSRDNAVSRFRKGVGNNYLKYGVSYFPWVHTTVVGDAETTFQNLSRNAMTLLSEAAHQAVQAATHAATGSPALPAAGPILRRALACEQLVQAMRQLHRPAITAAQVTAVQGEEADEIRLHNALLAVSPNYARIIDGITRYRNTLPVAPALAGVYTAVDTSRGVWKAPANVGLSGVTAPTVTLTDNDQARLNVDAVSGKSINAIRPFPGLGVLVWGARTLDGNSQDWRYLNVCRTMIMLEQSIKLAVWAYVFEPNDANTWVTVQSMLSSFLFNLWKQGALAGSQPADAYSVSIGLGTTMTAQDVLDGYMNVFVKVAISKPAEFIVLSFQPQMQKA